MVLKRIERRKGGEEENLWMAGEGRSSRKERGIGEKRRRGGEGEVRVEW